MHGTERGSQKKRAERVRSASEERQGGENPINRKINLKSPAVQKRLPHLLQVYVESCRPPPDAEPKRGASGGTLPTLAGFCRFLGISQGAIARLGEENPDVTDRILTTLEDELLNFAPSPTLLNSYMKKRLGYGEERPRETKETSCGQLRLVFEHDIEEDGA